MDTKKTTSIHNHIVFTLILGIYICEEMDTKSTSGSV